MQSPNALAHLPHLDIPRPESPGRSGGPSNDFATGYSLGLIGGVRSWVSVTSTSLHVLSTGVSESGD